MLLDKREVGVRYAEPGCFSAGYERSFCCDESRYLGGPMECWESDTFSFDVCCREDGPTVTLEPPSPFGAVGGMGSINNSTDLETRLSCLGAIVENKASISNNCNECVHDLGFTSEEIAEGRSCWQIGGGIRWCIDLPMLAPEMKSRVVYSSGPPVE